MKLSGPVADAVRDNFRRSLRDGSGCGFAASFVTGGRVAFEVHDEPPTSEVNDALDAYAANDLVVVLLLPFVTHKRTLVEVLLALRTGSPRWRLRERSRTADTVQVGVEWTTSTNLIDDTMGFAPLLAMPVPRRTPYAAIALWPGGHANPLRGIPPTPPAKKTRVSFLDVRHDFDQATNENMWKTTEARVGELMMLPPDRASLYRQVAFALSATAVDPDERHQEAHAVAFATSHLRDRVRCPWGPLPVIQELMGHEDIATTMRYVSVNLGQKDDAIALAFGATVAPERQQAGNRPGSSGSSGSGNRFNDDDL